MISAEIDKITRRHIPGDTLFDAQIVGMSGNSGVYSVKFSNGSRAVNVPGPPGFSVRDYVMVARNGGENVVVNRKTGFSGDIVEVEV